MPTIHSPSYRQTFEMAACNKSATARSYQLAHRSQIGPRNNYSSDPRDKLLLRAGRPQPVGQEMSPTSTSQAFAPGAREISSAHPTNHSRSLSRANLAPPSRARSTKRKAGSLSPAF